MMMDVCVFWRVSKVVVVTFYKKVVVAFCTPNSSSSSTLARFASVECRDLRDVINGCSSRLMRVLNVRSFIF